MRPIRLAAISGIGKAQTNGADALAFQLTLAGIIGWERELTFHPPRRFRFDFAFRAAMLAIECDGGIFTRGRHVRGAGVLADCEKYALAVIDGWRVMRVTPTHVKSGEALAWIEAAIRPLRAAVA